MGQHSALQTGADRNFKTGKYKIAIRKDLSLSQGEPAAHTGFVGRARSVPIHSLLSLAQSKSKKLVLCGAPPTLASLAFLGSIVDPLETNAQSAFSRDASLFSTFRCVVEKEEASECVMARCTLQVTPWEVRWQRFVRWTCYMQPQSTACPTSKP